MWFILIHKKDTTPYTVTHSCMHSITHTHARTWFLPVGQIDTVISSSFLFFDGNYSNTCSTSIDYTSTHLYVQYNERH